MSAFVNVTHSSHLRSAFVVALPKNVWLRAYTQDGASATPELQEAKLFYAEERAEYVANLLGGRVREVLVNADGTNLRLCAKHEPEISHTLEQIDKHIQNLRLSAYSGERTVIE